MASDLSSGCTDDIFEEKEEGELSLEDVSSSEESHPNYRSDFRAVGQCVNCMGMRICAPWCPSARAARKSHRKLDAAHGKENRRHAKDPTSSLPKPTVATLQEKNDDLVPISSDSDMEIVGLPGNSKQQLHARSKSGAKVRKKKKKKRSHSSVLRIEGSLSPPQVETYLVDVPIVKKVRSSRSHHRDPSPPRFDLERPLARSPPRRYRATRALKSRSPPRRSRSPASRPNLPDRKSSPRKLRSPRRSPPASRSPIRPGLARATRDPRISSPPENHTDIYAAKPLKKIRRVESLGGGGGSKDPSKSKDHSTLISRNRVSSPPETHVDPYATQLLKKVRRLESVSSGSTKDLTKSNPHSSLKEKLSNMMKNQTEVQEKPNSRKRETVADVLTNEGEKNTINGVASVSATAAETDDEDDIELLRRLALETKQKKSEKIEETKAKSESDDNDNEANQLRILALKSAWIKKHEKRVTRGGKSRRPARPATRVESPFNESLFDDIQISGDEEEEDEELGAKSPMRFSPIADDASNRSEDMDLDTDVEREKENEFLAPYSPTDDLSRGIQVEDDLMTVNGDNNNEEKSRDERNARRGSSEGFGCVAGVDTPYSPSAPTETPILRKIKSRRPFGEKIARENGEISSSESSGNESPSYYLPGVDTPFSPPATPAKNIANTESPMSPTESPNSLAESPMSPTETPALDPILFPIFPDLPAVTTEICEDGKEEEKNAGLEVEKPENAVVNFDSADFEEKKIETTQESILGSREEEKCESQATILGNSAPPLAENLFRPIDTVDKLPEVDLDGSPLVPVSKELEGAELMIPIENSPEILQDPEVEPLYLRALSEVTRDANKMPIIANRTLVPALILKTNKRLQQPLPPKKLESHAEPSFKSAEMRPVSVDAAPVKSATLFKPIKLCPIAKKPQVMTTAAAAFSASFGDESMTENKSDDESVEPTISVKDAKIATNVEKSLKVDDATEEAKKSGAKSKKGGKLRNKKRFSMDAESPGCSKESSVASSRKSKPDAENASQPSERVTRASIRSSLVKSRENSRESAEKTAENKPTQRKNSLARSEKAAASNKKDTNEDGERKKKKSRRSKKKLKRLSSSSAGKSSDLDATRSSEQSAEKCGEDEETEANKNECESSNKVEEEAKKIEAERKRRCSMDEDEEELRALLLASLPKRTKPVETSQSVPTIPVAKIPQPSETATENSAIKLANESTTPRVIESAFTPVNSSAPSSQASNQPAISATRAKIEATTTTTTTNLKAVGQILTSESNGSAAEISPQATRKRANSVVVKGPPKKIVKKVLPALASTKVVNNAKKYQNALLQKKINMQRAAMTYSAQNGSRNITLNNLKMNDATRPSSPKITAASKTQRLVINLGSDTDSEAELENQPAKSAAGDAQTEVRKPLAIPTTDFEKSVVQFLKDQRKKLESGTVAKSHANTATPVGKATANSASPVAGKLSGLYNTPLAVRCHLSMSKQEEYRRLKQQIMERERQKLQKTIENGSQNPSLRSPCTPPGPLSPASPISSSQKSQTTQKLPIVAPQIPTGVPPPSIKDKSLENPTIQKKIELPKANENRPVAIVTKVTKTVVPAIPIKQPTKPLASSTKLNSNIPNVPSSSKIPPKIPPKSSFVVASANFPSNTSTPKSQPSIASKTFVSISARSSLQFAPEKRGNFAVDAPSTSKKFPTESSTSRSADRWSLGTISVPSLPPSTSSVRRSSNPTEMLTIQIPNDKIQTERTAGISSGISKRESSSPPNGRNTGMLKILTKEQLNSRFVQIKVKQGSSGRTVTVGGSPLSQDDASRSASSSPTARIFPDGRSDKTICCDSSLIVNEIAVTRRGDSEVGDSEASTLVLSRSDGSSSKIGNSDASTLVVDRDSTADSAASTFVMVHDNSECRGSPGVARDEDGGLAAPNAGTPRQTKVQVKEEFEKIRADVRNELEILTALPAEQQRVILMETQENLVAKRNMILDDLTAMSGCLRQWEVEREIQTRLIAEVRRLREQLRTAEKHLHEQRRQMNGMGPRVSKAHEKINQGRREVYKLSRICHGLGSHVIGDDYKVPDTGAQQLNERMKEVAVHTRQLSKKKVPPIGAASNSRDTSSPASSTGSDSVSENSLSERATNSTLPSSETANAEEATNSSTSEIDLDITRLARENPEPPESSNADSPHQNPISEKPAEATEKIEEQKPAESSQETRISDGVEKEAQSKNVEISSETNAETVEVEESDELVEINAQTREKEASSSSECKTNESSGIPAANLISEDRFEDIPAASTSKYRPRGYLMPSDEKPHVKTKKTIDPYKSVLTHLKSSRSVNPDGILCPYELMGTCSDGDCQFYHLDPGHCQ